MRFEDERYVRVYTRDTVTWKMLPWQGKTLLALLFRKVDRAGILEVGDHGVEGLAALVDLPVEVVEAGLPALIKSRTAQWTGEHGTVLVLPNFLGAQEAHTSDAQRKRDQRERAAAAAVLEALEMSRSVTERHASGQNVTQSHSGSQTVTAGHSDPCLSVPSLTVLDPEETLAQASPSQGECVQEGLDFGPPRPSFDFDAVYDLYPRKGPGKKKGLERCRSKIKTQARYAALIAAVKNYAAYVAGTEEQYIKLFETFMSAWEDWIEPRERPAARSPPGIPLSTSVNEASRKLRKW